MRLLPQEGLGIIATLFHEKGLAMSTNYSGIGMWETAVAYVGEALGGAQVTNFHACDIDEDCLRVLLQHQGLSKPQHVLENLENRWPTDVLRELRREETRFDDVLREESQSGMDSKSRRKEIGLHKLQAFAGILDSAQQGHRLLLITPSAMQTVSCRLPRIAQDGRVSHPLWFPNLHRPLQTNPTATRLCRKDWGRVGLLAC